MQTLSESSPSQELEMLEACNRALAVTNAHLQDISGQVNAALETVGRREGFAIACPAADGLPIVLFLLSFFNIFAGSNDGHAAGHVALAVAARARPAG